MAATQDAHPATVGRGTRLPRSHPHPDPIRRVTRAAAGIPLGRDCSDTARAAGRKGALLPQPSSDKEETPLPRHTALPPRTRALYLSVPTTPRRVGGERSRAAASRFPHPSLKRRTGRSFHRRAARAHPQHTMRARARYTTPLPAPRQCRHRLRDPRYKVTGISREEVGWSEL